MSAIESARMGDRRHGSSRVFAMARSARLSGVGKGHVQASAERVEPDHAINRLDKLMPWPVADQLCSTRADGCF